VAGKFESLFRELIQIWRGGVSAVEGHISPTKVIGNDEDDVWFACFRLKGREQKGEENQEAGSSQGHAVKLRFDGDFANT
jgi:hypothetical protein